MNELDLKNFICQMWIDNKKKHDELFERVDRFDKEFKKEFEKWQHPERVKWNPPKTQN